MKGLLSREAFLLPAYYNYTKDLDNVPTQAITWENLGRRMGGEGRVLTSRMDVRSVWGQPELSGFIFLQTGWCGMQFEKLWAAGVSQNDRGTRADI